MNDRDFQGAQTVGAAEWLLMLVVFGGGMLCAMQFGGVL